MKYFIKRDIFYNFGILIALFFIIIVFSFLSPVFLTFFNIINILKQSAVIGLLASSLTLVMIMGEIDLSFAGLLCFLGVCAAVWQGPAQRKTIAETGEIFEMPILLVIISVILAGCLLGAIIGLIIVKVKVSGFLVTLGALAIFEGFGYLYSGGRGVTGLKNSYKVLGQGEFYKIPYIIIISIFCIIVLSIILRKTRLGKYIFAVGSNTRAAFFAGIPVNLIKIVVFVIMGLSVAIGAILLTSRLNSAPPKPQPYYLIDAISACIIGGVSLKGGEGSIEKTIIGVLILGVIYNGLTLLGVSVSFQYILKGFIIIGAIVLDSIKYMKREF